MRKFNLKPGLTYVVGALSGVALSIAAYGYAASQPKSGGITLDQAKVFAEAFAKIKFAYYEDTDNDDLVKNALKGMVSSLDPHSEYILKKDMHAFSEDSSGEFGGLGIEISKRDGMITVIAPIEDTPAWRAGLQSNDKIITIDGHDSKDWSTSKAVSFLRGKPGTKVKITVLRKTVMQPLEFNLERAIIRIKSVRSKLLEPDYGYVKLTQFQNRTHGDLISHLVDLEKSNGGRPLKGLVLDLRNNPGGLLSSAIAVTSLFVPSGEVVVKTKGRNNEFNMNTYRSEDKYATADVKLEEGTKTFELPENYKTVPIVTLINSGSASASEIVTGALQDHARTVVVGKQSFGKGSVQSLLPLSDGTAVKLTISLYYSPSDRSIQAQGIVPDIEVDGEDEHYVMREADLSGHIDNPKGGEEVKGKISTIDPSKDKVEVKSVEELENERYERALKSREVDPENDKQLKKGLEILKDAQVYKDSIGKFKPIEKEKLEDMAKKEQEEREAEEKRELRHK